MADDAATDMAAWNTPASDIAAPDIAAPDAVASDAASSTMTSDAVAGTPAGTPAGGSDPLGAFLRSRRERLAPEAVGLAGTSAGSGRRRTPGLRREEVARLAGISAEWYVRLEQGRAVAPSAATVDALARALRLGPVEHAHLRALARPRRRPAFVRETVPDALARLVAGLDGPAYLTGRRFDVLAWNDAAAELFGFGALAPGDRNVLLLVLTDPRGRALFGEGWAEEARRMVALLRAAHDVFADDPAFVDLAARLRAGCAEFEGWWTRHDVAAPVSGTKRLHHPERGARRFAYSTFQANDDPALKLALYVPC